MSRPDESLARPQFLYSDKLQPYEIEIDEGKYSHILQRDLDFDSTDIGRLTVRALPGHPLSDHQLSEYKLATATIEVRARTLYGSFERVIDLDNERLSRQEIATRNLMYASARASEHLVKGKPIPRQVSLYGTTAVLIAGTELLIQEGLWSGPIYAAGMGLAAIARILNDLRYRGSSRSIAEYGEDKENLKRWNGILTVRQRVN